MKRSALWALALVGLAATVFTQTRSIVSLVQVAAKAGDFATAQSLLDAYKKTSGVTPEYIAERPTLSRMICNVSGVV